jgi:hypothetical protein
MKRRVVTICLGFVALTYLSAVLYAATITLNARQSGLWQTFSGVTLAHCHFSGTVQFSDSAHGLTETKFYLSGVFDSAAGGFYNGSNNWGYGDYSLAKRAVGSGPYQTEDVAIGEVIATHQTLGVVASGSADWSPVGP